MTMRPSKSLHQLRENGHFRRGVVAILTALVILVAVVPQSVATGHTAWVLLDAEGEIGSGNSGPGIAKDNSDIRSLKLERNADSVQVTLELASLQPPHPDLPPPARLATDYALRFSTGDQAVLVTLSIFESGVSPAWILVQDTQGGAFEYDTPAALTANGITFGLSGFESPWNDIRVEAAARMCVTLCMRGLFVDRAPDLGTAPTFP